MARYQVRGPHGSTRDNARWTVVDTTDRDITVHTARTKADALEAARELNATGEPANTPPPNGCAVPSPDPGR